MDNTIISLTSIPSRFKYLPAIIQQLERQNVNKIWLNIPYSYKRFPNENVIVPDIQTSNLIINRCQDYGPGTMYFGPIDGECTAENIIVVNDDTSYPNHMSEYYKNLIKEDESCWCTSGFNIAEYCMNNGKVNRYNHEKIDVTESYGGVILKLDWLRQIKPEFEKLLDITYNDDILVSNLMSKLGIDKKSINNEILNISMIKQYSYGMDQDALWQNNGEGSHVPNNKRVFKTLSDKGVYYFS